MNHMPMYRERGKYFNQANGGCRNIMSESSSQMSEITIMAILIEDSLARLDALLSLLFPFPCLFYID